MPEPAVVNTLPLIFLSKAGLLNFLQLVADEVLVPNTVADEINRRGPGDVTARDLGPSESAVLAYAHSYPGTTEVPLGQEEWKLVHFHSQPTRGY